MKSRSIKYNIIPAVITLTAIVILTGTLFDHYFEFNDDVLMKDILSGAYTGRPEALNIQMLSPLSAVLSLLYRVTGAVPWYGLFLLACQYLTLGLIIVRALSMTDSLPGRIIMGVTGFLVSAGFLISHLVLVQYTITVAIMAAGAGFLIYTTHTGLDKRTFFSQMIIPVILIVLGFMLRSEMMLLMMPFLCFGACSLIHRDFIEAGDTKAGNRTSGNAQAGSNQDATYIKKPVSGLLARYIIVAAVTGTLLLLSYGIDKISYSSSGWKEFRAEFDSRTQLYDYQYIPDYEEAQSFYVSKGITPIQVELLKKYDYGIDSRIDGDMMNSIARYAADSRQESVGARLAASCKEYFYRCSHLRGGVYSALILFLYVMTGFAIIHNRPGRDVSPGAGNAISISNSSRINGNDSIQHRIVLFILRICGLFAMRSVCWMYIIYGRRMPDRITHSLYIVEAVMLLAMILTEYAGTLRGKRYLKMVTAVVLIVSGIVILPMNIKSLRAHIASREKINSYARAIDEYCALHPENFYWEDVYSTIIEGETFNEKMFEAPGRMSADHGRFGNSDDGSTQTAEAFKNYDLIGGWCMNSPLLKDKIAVYGIEDIADDLIHSGNTYVISADIYDTDWISDYYEETGIAVSVTRVDTIADYFGVYQCTTDK